MAFVIHLQNLPRDATSSNVRDFFEGLHIADGGVHITNSYDGSVFITFTSETDAYTGMELDGRLMFGERIKLSLCTEEEKEERLASLQEEEQILQDCQEYDDNPYNFRTQHGSKVASSFGRQAPTLRAGEVDTHHQPLKYRYYIHILHVDKGVTEYHLRDFFKGVAAHIPEGGIVLDHNLSQAYVQFDNCRAFEISLKMDESVVCGRRVKIKMCSKNKFEKAKKYCSHLKVPYKGDKYKKTWNPEAEGLKFNRDEGRRQPEAFYMHVQNIDKSVKVYDLKMFLRGWAKYVPKDGIIFKEHKEAFRMSEAYVCFNSEEAFRSSLLMDGRALNETQVKITECTEKEFRENEKFGTDHGFSDFVKTNPPWEKHEKDGNVSHGASNAIRTSAPWEEGTKPFVPWETQSRYEEQPSSRAYQKARHFSEDTSQREFVGQGSRHTMHTSRNSDWDDMYKSRNQRLDDRPNQYTFQQPKRTVPFCVVISNLYCRAIVDDILSILSKVSIKPKRTEIRVAEDLENSFKRLAFVKLFNEECYHQALSLDRVWFGGEQLSISGCSEKDFYFKYTAADSSSVREHSTPNQQEAPQMDSQIPFLFLGDLDDSVSPKDIRNVFGVLSFSIPSDGIIIRPDVKGQGKYVAFVKFDDPEILIQAQEIWRGIDGGIQINDRKVFLSKCTSRMIVQYDLSRELKRFKFKAGNPNSGNFPKIDRRGRSDSPASVRIGQPSAAQGNPMYGHQSMYPATSRVPVYSGSLSERLRASLAATPNLNVLDFKPRSRSRSPLQQESKRRSQSWSRSVSRSRSRSVSRSRSRSVSRSRYRSVSQSHSRSVSRSRSRSRSRSYTRSRSRSRSRSLSPNQVRRSRSPVSDIFRRRQSSFSRSRSQSRGRSSSRSPRSLSSDNENSKPWGDNGDIPAFRINGRFIRISPLPIWANEVWIYDIFSDVNLNRDSILIKYLDKTPLHAYVECVTDDDFEKAIKRNGMIVGTDKIFVEPLGKNF